MPVLFREMTTPLRMLANLGPIFALLILCGWRFSFPPESADSESCNRKSSSYVFLENEGRA
jgi:hypothetical protein